MGLLFLHNSKIKEWKSARKTRQFGYSQIVGALFPMLVVIGYSYVQGLAKDFKEMMTGIIALFIAIYHVVRTAWGLIKLCLYRSWCAQTLSCIRAISPRKSMEDDDEVILDELLKVNSELVDN